MFQNVDVRKHFWICQPIMGKRIDSLKVLRFLFPVPVVGSYAKDFYPLQRAKFAGGIFLQNDATWCDFLHGKLNKSSSLSLALFCRRKQKKSTAREKIWARLIGKSRKRGEVVVVICAICAGYGVCKSFSAKLFLSERNFWWTVPVFRHLNVDYTIFFTVILSDLIKLSLSFTKTKT